MSYLFVLVAVEVVLVLVVASVDALLQPVTKAPITSPNSTIRVYVLFIGCATFDQFRKKASTFFSHFCEAYEIRRFTNTHRTYRGEAHAADAGFSLSSDAPLDFGPFASDQLDEFSLAENVSCVPLPRLRGIL